MRKSKLILAVLLIGTVLVGCKKNELTQSSSVSAENVETANSSVIIDRSERSHSTSKSETSDTSTSSDALVEGESIVEEQIVNGDYTSLNGTWTNSNGYQVTINDGEINLPDKGVGGVTQFSLNNPQKADNVIYLSFDPAPIPNGMNLLIVLKGSSPTDGTKDGTDSSKDRFIMGNNGGTTLFQTRENGGISDTAYYREN